jgi:hypothetical protein
LIHGIREAAVPNEVPSRLPDARMLVIACGGHPEVGLSEWYFIYRDQVDLAPGLAIDPEEVDILPVVPPLTRSGGVARIEVHHALSFPARLALHLDEAPSSLERQVVTVAVPVRDHDRLAGMDKGCHDGDLRAFADLRGVHALDIRDMM